MFEQGRIMKWLDCTDGVLRVSSAPKDIGWPGGAALDRVLPCEGSIFDLPLASRAVHELLFDSRAGDPPPAYLALRFLNRIVTGTGRAVTGIWCDPFRTLYPPALAAEVPLGNLFLAHPKPVDVTWAAAECLRCPGVGVVVASLPTRLTRVEARRLQLAAERGGGIGLMLRSTGRGDDIYSAATRWLVSPAPGERGVQRWDVQLIHGHGRFSGQSFVLENRRAPDPDFGRAPIPVHPSAPLVDHPAVAEAG
jgi:hypothetical protein